MDNGPSHADCSRRIMATWLVCAGQTGKGFARGRGLAAPSEGSGALFPCVHWAKSLKEVV
jgi:hypothetical protein